MTIHESPIKEVYVDSASLSSERHEVLPILEESLGAAAIECVDEPQEADAMIVLGGDGSFLHALHRHGFPSMPITGINTGTLGFYMDTSPAEEAMSSMAKRLASGMYIAKRLPLLEVPIGNGEDMEYAANEVVVERRTSQAFKASLKIGEGTFDHFVGDGFIFATPQGSTSYSLSAGGPILQEGMNAYVVTPSNPHMSHQYFSLGTSAVVSGEKESIVTVKEAEKRPFDIGVDDRMITDWPEGETDVRIRVSKDKQLCIVRFAEHDYFERVSRTFRGKQEPER